MSAVELLHKRHLAEAAQLERLAFAEPWSEDALALLLTPPHFGIAALEDGALCSYGGVVVAADEGEITNIVTHPEKRRRGFAECVLREMLCESRRRGLVRLTLEVRVSNEGAQALYRKLGFADCGIRKGLYRFPREDGTVMQICLS